MMNPELSRKFTLPKSERLCSQKTISGLFKPGFFIKGHPLQISYSFTEPVDPDSPRAQVLFVVSKKKIRTAVGRNRAKRMLREIYRLNKHPLIDALESKQKHLALAIIFNNHSLLSSAALREGFLKVFQKLIKELSAE